MTSTKETDMTTVASTPKRRPVASAWAAEHDAARGARQQSDHAAEWRHLERAHILSQPFALPHLRTHAAMLAYGFRHQDRREVLGQIIRLVLAAPGSWSGRYPVGNTGGAQVSALQPMPIPDDLRAILASSVQAARAP
jgi:hypothetical protein